MSDRARLAFSSQTLDPVLVGKRRYAKPSRQIRCTARSDSLRHPLLRRSIPPSRRLWNGVMTPLQLDELPAAMCRFWPLALTIAGRYRPHRPAMPPLNTSNWRPRPPNQPDRTARRARRHCRSAGTRPLPLRLRPTACRPEARFAPACRTIRAQRAQPRDPVPLAGDYVRRDRADDEEPSP